MDWTSYLFRFGGRINRALFWQSLLIVLLLAGLLGLIGQAIHVLGGQRSFTSSLTFSSTSRSTTSSGRRSRTYRLLPSADRPTLLLKAFGMALFLWIYLATAIKRLHDRDRRGWWIVPFFVVPGLFSQFSDLLPDSNWVLAIFLVMQIAWLWGAIEMFCLRGKGGNRFRSRSAGGSRGQRRVHASPRKSWDQQSELEIVRPR
jgi:uncharacterized membrane protein YhaH (DUF805 family)